MKVRLNSELLCRAGTSQTLLLLHAHLYFFQSGNLGNGIDNATVRLLRVTSTHKDAEPGVCGSGRTHWANVDLREGDEITIKLVKHGAITKPLGPFSLARESDGEHTPEDNTCDLKPF